MRFGEPLVIGQRLKLDFSEVAAEAFERHRVAYHQALQARYFAQYRIAGVREHMIQDGDNLWVLATRDYKIPVWLLRQYNPDVDFETVLPPGSRLSVPLVHRVAQTGDSRLAAASPAA
jgi:membrane-bound lytic murein transglycosylase D